MIDREELAAWLRLTLTPGLGRDPSRKLLAAFGSAEAAIAASTEARRTVVPGAAAAALASPPEGFEQSLSATVEWLEAAESDAPRAILTLADPRYPTLLLQTADPPLLLYAMGRLELLQAPSIAIVGSRGPSAQGLDNARAFGSHLSRAGLTVVSGLALGVDGAAHEGALEGNGSTIAVVGTGLDRVYPKSHLALARRIAAQGLLVSELALGAPPLPAHFPSRNRIIAGLSQGTLVVEAAPQSGSLITARLAAEAGREVFAIPGSIHLPQSRGCHLLIKQGAKLVESAQDILEELRLQAPPPPSSKEPGSAIDETEANPLLEALGYDPVSMDALVARTGWPAAELSARLLELEFDGQVARLPGHLFQRRASA